VRAQLPAEVDIEGRAEQTASGGSSWANPITGGSYLAMRKVITTVCVAIMLGLVASFRLPVQAQQFQPGAVFVMTNDATANNILAFSRSVDGSLIEQGQFATGGRGSGGAIDPLHSQGSLTLSGDDATLFAVNAGSGDVSIFRVHGAQLELAQVVPSGGASPVAVTVRAGLVYVLNAGPTASVVAFRRQADGTLTQIGSAASLSANAAPSGLAVSPSGQFLAVSDRNNGLIDTFRINSDGTLGSLVSSQSSGAGPFSVEFASSGALLVTEANNSSISSYAVQSNGTLAAIAASVSTAGAAPCWHAITPDGRFVYVDNAGTSTIAGFAIAPNGSLNPVGATVVATLADGSTNLDITVTQDGKFLYTLNAGAGTIGIFAVQRDGSLVGLGTAGQFGAGAGENGIAAF
jgi:6-phosphogluconolactonase